MSTLTRIGPCDFVHVTDLRTNITRVERGPQTLFIQTHEQLASGPLPLIVIPPGYYCEVENPCERADEGQQCVLHCGHREIRCCQQPFVLYPGEVLMGAEDFGRSSPMSGVQRDYQRSIRPLPVVLANEALRLEAVEDFDDGGVQRKAGDQWQLEGPRTYVPVSQAKIVQRVRAVVLKDGEALRLRAVRDFRDNDDRSRTTGEEWLVSGRGAYLPGVFEEVVKIEKAVTLTEKLALHLRATQNVVDAFGNTRHTGDEWLLTVKDTDSYIPIIGVDIVKVVERTVLSKNQYCVVVNIVDDHQRPQLGKKQLRKGVTSFFLHPDELLENGIENALILSDDQAVVLRAVEKFTDTTTDGKKIKRVPGDRWMIHGPTDYIPPIYVQIVYIRIAIPLSKNEGVYVRDTRSGAVSAVMGPRSLLLNENEVFYEKQLSDEVEQMLKNGGGIGDESIRKIAYFEQSIDPVFLQERVKHRVITYRCPSNSACQVYNYKKREARVIFGPDLVVLGPHENFNVLSLSAGKPKKPNALKSLVLMLGPDFITDIIEVETSDHARLRIQLAFNNFFEVDKNDFVSAQKIFAVPDFIVFVCNQVGARIRGAVAQIPFDEFHRHSSAVIQHSVLGTSAEGKLNDRLCFPENNLVIMNVDVQNIEPVDKRMRDSLQKSIQQAIEIATMSVERSAGHEATRVEQVAKGRLEREKIHNDREAERERIKLHEIQAVTAAVESTGQAVAEAEAQRERMKIEGESNIKAARLSAEAAAIEHNSQLDTRQMMQDDELSYKRRMNRLEAELAGQLTAVEVKKFARMINILGRPTIKAIVASGPEHQVQLLQGLGIETALITNGNKPINILAATSQLISKRS